MVAGRALLQRHMTFSCLSGESPPSGYDSNSTVQVKTIPVLLYNHGGVYVAVHEPELHLLQVQVGFALQLPADLLKGGTTDC